jgi:hypothetical protein
LEWFENFRLRHGMEAGREAANAFWKVDVKPKERERKKWWNNGRMRSSGI